MHALHMHGLLHGEIRPENVLLMARTLRHGSSSAAGNDDGTGTIAPSAHTLPLSGPSLGDASSSARLAAALGADKSSGQVPMPPLLRMSYSIGESSSSSAFVSSEGAMRPTVRLALLLLTGHLSGRLLEEGRGLAGKGCGYRQGYPPSGLRRRCTYGLRKADPSITSSATQQRLSPPLLHTACLASWSGCALACGYLHALVPSQPAPTDPFHSLPCASAAP